MTKSTSTPMTIAESYAEGIVDLSVKLQKGNLKTKKPLLDENDQVNPQPGDELLTGDDYTAAVNAIRLQDKETRDC